MQPTTRPLVAAAWMCGSVLAFSAMAVSGRFVSTTHDTFEIMTWRSLVGLIAVLAVSGLTGRLRAIRTDRVPSHFLRNICHFTGQNLWFWALSMIPIAQVIALEFTSPLWVILLSPLVLGEKLTLRKLVAACIGFAGAMTVAQPDFSNISPGVAAAATSAIFFALTAILTKALTRGESIVSILFWLTLMQLCFGLICAGLDGAILLPTVQTLPWLIVIGLAGVSAHMCLTMALSVAPASIVIPMDFARLPLIAVAGMLIFGEPLGISVLLGGVLILIGNAINIRATRQQVPANATATQRR